MTIILPNHNEPNIENLVKQICYYYPEAKVIVSNDPTGRGKGWALRKGLEEVGTFPLVFMDGDMDIDPYEITKLLPHLEHYDVVVGKKDLPVKFKRRLVTYLSRVWIKLLFGLNLDSQTGLKVFKYRPSWNTDSWAFDIEILYKAKKDKLKMIEIPIKATVSDSKSLKDIWITLKDSLKIRFRS